MGTAFVGVDLGTSGVKVVVLSATGEPIAAAKRTYEVRRPFPGAAEADPAEWWQATCSATSEAVTAAGDPAVAAVGLDGQMHGVVLADAGGDPVRPAITWADTRATDLLPVYRKLPEGVRRAL